MTENLGKNIHKSQQIVITGATGMVGSYLASILGEKGHKIKALYREKSRIPSFLSFKNVKWLKGDILDILTLDELISEGDVVIHCASITDFGQQSQMIKANVKGTERIVNICLENCASRLIYFSSVSTRTPDKNGLISESSVSDSRLMKVVYSRSKIMAEMEVERGKAEGLDADILIPSTIFSAGFNDRNSGIYFSKASKRLNFYTTGSSGFVDIRDISLFVENLIKLPSKNQTYLLSNQNNSHFTIISAINQLFGNPPPKVKITGWKKGLFLLGDRIGSFLGFKKREMYKDMIYFAGLNLNCDSSKSRNDFGFKYRPLEETLQWVFDNFPKPN